MKWFLSAMLLGSLALTGLADPTPADKASADKPSADKAAAQKPGTMSDDQLKEMLDDLGYAPKTITLKTGRKLYHVKLNRDGWDFHFAAQMSTDNTVIWLSCRLCQLPAAGKVRGDVIEKLLKFNLNLAPGRFVLKHDRFVALDVPLYTADLKAADLRQTVDNFLTVVKHTHSTWADAAKPADAVASK